MAAYAINHQSSIYFLVPNQQFIDLGAVNSPAPPFLPPPPLSVLNPSSLPPFLALNQSVLAFPPLALIRMEQERSLSLIQFMANEGLVPSPEEEIKRRNVIDNLKQIVMAWIKRVAFQRRLPKQYIATASASILTYGSYGLGEDFFIVLHNMLASRADVSEIHCVKDAKVPLMRFKFDGISIDMPYAQLQVISVPENVDIFNPLFMRNIDETSWKCLSGVRANKSILRLVPNVEIFQSVLRCVKLWAKRRGVYGNLHGFLGGVHLAILVAFICQKHLNASLSVLISSFFKTFAFWPWPTPVVLQDGMSLASPNATETRSLMPIQLPCSPHEYCHSNITRSTFYRIRAEFLRGHAITKDLMSPDFKWTDLFDPFVYTRRYTRFLKVRLLASDNDQLGDWEGWVKSRFRALLVKVEEAHGFCDPNPTEYADADVKEPNVVFYWGLQSSKSELLDIDSVEDEFLKNISNGYQGSPGKIELSIVQASELPKGVQFDVGNGKCRKACWRILDCSHQMVPVYSRHLPCYFVGYVAANANSVQ